MKLATMIQEGQAVKLARLDAGAPSGMDKAGAQEQLAKLSEELRRLQELLYAAGTHSVLIILQGMDTSGKGGTIRHVVGAVNPQGCRVESFKVPTAEELGHDFLWRIHRVTPRKGQMAVFDRSQYEDVLVVRVRELVPKNVWSRRYDHINHFERLLAEEQTVVLKFFLHISKKEQEERLLAREKDVTKAWKLAVNDWQQRELWDKYQRAYEDAISHCSTKKAPWYVVPADKKWFRNLAVASAIVDALKPLEPQWNKALKSQSEERLKELETYRADTGASKAIAPE